MSELEETRVALEMAELIGRVLADHLGFDSPRVLRQAELDEQAPPRFSAFFLTLLAWSAARDELRGEPLPADVTADFLRNVASRRTAGPEAPGRALESLVRRLAERANLSPREISVLQAYGRFALEKLAEECAGLDPGSAAESKLTCLILEPE